MAHRVPVGLSHLPFAYQMCASLFGQFGFRAQRTQPPLATTESVRCFGVALYRAQAHTVAPFGFIRRLRLGVDLERHTAELAATLSAELCAGLSIGAVWLRSLR